LKIIIYICLAQRKESAMNEMPEQRNWLLMPGINGHQSIKLLLIKKTKNFKLVNQ
jgi:hypothetical protein